jgi:hypothetical protein
MNPGTDHGSTGATTNPATRLPVDEELAAMDREALLALVDGVFRWALRHTGLTRQQIIAQIRRDREAAP